MVIDDLKILIDAVAGMEGTVIYVLLGYIIYQLVIFGGTTGAVVAILRLLILKVHNVLITEKSKATYHEISLDGQIITSEGNYAAIREAFRLVREHGPTRISSSFLHDDDCDYLLAAVQEKIENDKKKKEI